MLDIVSGAISYIPFLVFAWILVAMVVFIIDPIVGFFVIIELAMVFLLHFIVSEGIFKLGAGKIHKVRQRPAIAFPKEIRPIGSKTDSSFPSSHVAAMVGGVFILISFYSNLLFLGILSVIIMSWSRMRNGMHYPTDILAGVFLGLLYGWGVTKILNVIF